VREPHLQRVLDGLSMSWDRRWYSKDVTCLRLPEPILRTLDQVQTRQRDQEATRILAPERLSSHAAHRLAARLAKGP
jgi:hypothetical protein